MIDSAGPPPRCSRKEMLSKLNALMCKMCNVEAEARENINEIDGVCEAGEAWSGGMCISQFYSPGKPHRTVKVNIQIIVTALYLLC